MSRFSSDWLKSYLAKQFRPEQAPSTGAVEDESQLHSEIIEYCISKGWLYFHGSMAHRTRRTPGEPDLTIVASEGRVFFVECKAKGGKLSSDQAEVMAWAQKLGHTIHLVYSFEQFLDAVTR